MKSFKFVCLFLALGISIVAAQQDPELPELSNSDIFCAVADGLYPECDGVYPQIEPALQDPELPKPITYNPACDVIDGLYPECDGVSPPIEPAQQDPEFPELIPSDYYCDLPASEVEVCPEIYEPVCADYYGFDDLPDYASYNFDAVLSKTYPSACSACQDGSVISYRYGPCEGDCGEECEEDCPDCGQIF